MTKVINFADLRRPPVVILDIDGVKHPMKAASVDDFLFHIEIAEKSEAGLLPKDELLAMIQMILRAFPTLTEAQVRSWSPDEINQISVMARGGEVEISEEDASGKRTEGKLNSVDLGFLFAKVMREFGLSFDDVLDLPIKRFWFLVNQVDRLRAEQDIRQTHILAGVTSQESLNVALESLGKEMGRVYLWTEPEAKEIKLRVDPVTGLDPEFDREGLRALRALM